MSDRAPLDRRAAAIGLATVVLANLVYCTGLIGILDPQMGMDPLYIQLARRPLREIVRYDPAWGPLYGLWFTPLVAVLGDPVAVYAANIYVLSIAITAVLFGYVLLLTRRTPPAVLAALFFMISDLNVPLAGKVSAFALLVVLVGLALAELLPRGAPRLAAVAMGTVVASYARPELWLAGVSLCALAVGAALRRRRAPGGRVLLWPACAVAVLAASWATLGSPQLATTADGDRLLVAFREHFAWNWIAWAGASAPFDDIWRRAFGDAASVWQAVLHNPGAVARHLADNLMGSVVFLGRTAFAHYPVLAPATWPSLVRAEAAAASLAIVGGLALAAARPAIRRTMVQRYGHLAWPYVILAGSCVTSAVVIYPLARYLLIPAVLLLIAGTLALALLVPDGRPWSGRAHLLAALVCLAAVPRPFVLPSAYVPDAPPFTGSVTVTRPILDTLEFIRSLPLTPPVQVLTFTDGIGEMLGPGFNEVKVWQRGSQPLEEYVRERRVDVIVTMEGGRGSFLVDDPYWTRLQAAPEATGFVQRSVPTAAQVRIYVRADRLPQLR